MDNKAVKLFQVDAFTEKPFSGNPAAVCLLPAPATRDWMQAVAQEMNLSETAFLWRLEEGFSLRWFTPATEVNLCGHATLASAHTLWSAGVLQTDEIAHFHTRSGLLTAEFSEGYVVLNFPALFEEPASVPAAFLDALGVEPEYVGMFGNKHIIEVASEEMVRNLSPDFAALRQFPGRGVIVTSIAGPSAGYDFVSRYFAPWVGIDEDPVTGSAHCCLGPFWGKRLGKDTLSAYQASARGGMLRVQVLGERVLLFGKAVTVFTGELTGFEPQL